MKTFEEVQSQMSNQLAYRPDIDGLRAVAVLSVVIFHATNLLSGGYIGVDIFFVISGYLITSLILKDLESGHFCMIQFWERRARRIMPAMAVVSISTLIAGWFLLLPHDFKELAQCSVALSAMLTNFYFWREGGYFAGPAELKPLLHMWSLAVEEQFYLIVAPISLILFYKLRHLISLIVAILMCGSFLWSLDRVSSAPDAAFYLLPSRAWELLLGSFMALHGERVVLKRWFAEALSYLGAFAMVFASCCYDHKTAFPGMAALLPCLGTAALIWSHSSLSTFLGKVLSLQPMVFIGRISYSIYLWHWPIIAYANYFDVSHSSIVGPIMLIALSMLVGGCSWLWIETPFRNRKMCETRRLMFFMSACSLILIFLMGVFIHLNHGFRQRFSPETLHYADARNDKNPRQNETMDLSLTSIIENGFPRIGSATATLNTSLFVIGDSHSDALFPVIERLCNEYHIQAMIANRHATFPLPKVYSEEDNIERSRFQQEVIKSINSTTSLKHILLVGRWNSYKNEFLSAEKFLKFHNNLNQKGIKFWIFRQIPEPTRDVPRTLALNSHFSRFNDHPGVEYRQFLKNRNKTDELFARIQENGANIIDPLEWFFPDKTLSIVKVKKNSMFYDDNHLSSFGALQLRPLLEPMFLQIVSLKVIP